MPKECETSLSGQFVLLLVAIDEIIFPLGLAGRDGTPIEQGRFKITLRQQSEGKKY